MALNLFGVTAATVARNHFPNVTFSGSSRPTDTAVGDMINDVAAEVCALLLEKGIPQDQIFAAGPSGAYPVSFQRIQSAIRKGTAVKAAPSVQQKDAQLVQLWSGEYKAFLFAVRTNGYLALGDAPAPAESDVGPRSHIDNLGLTTTDPNVSPDVIPPFHKDDML